MNLEQAIRGRWASHEPLSMRVPLSRFWTGTAPPGSDTPFAVLDVTRIEPRVATSSGRSIQHASLKISIVDGNLDEAQTIAREVEIRFERATIALDEGTVLDMRRERVEQHLSDDGVWTVALDYLAITEHFPQGD